MRKVHLSIKTLTVTKQTQIVFHSDAPSDVVLNGLVLSIIGVMVGGSYNLIVSTIAADLGKTSRLSSSKEALGTITGLIDGTGSVGSAVGQLVIAPINANFGWTWVFFVFAIMVSAFSMIVIKHSLEEFRLDSLPSSFTHQRR